MNKKTIRAIAKYIGLAYLFNIYYEWRYKKEIAILNHHFWTEYDNYEKHL